MRFKSTQNIFKDFSEVYDVNWMESNKIVLPPSSPWNYKKEMKIEDVDIWEVIYEQGGGVGVYAAWNPYAEFYLIRVGWFLESKNYGFETYYGPGAHKKVQKRMKDMNISYSINKIWVDPEDMWLYLDK
jgi:hypothetical protein